MSDNQPERSSSTGLSRLRALLLREEDDRQRPTLILFAILLLLLLVPALLCGPSAIHSVRTGEPFSLTNTGRGPGGASGDDSSVESQPIWPFSLFSGANQGNGSNAAGGPNGGSDPGDDDGSDGGSSSNGGGGSNGGSSNNNGGSNGGDPSGSNAGDPDNPDGSGTDVTGGASGGGSSLSSYQPSPEGDNCGYKCKDLIDELALAGTGCIPDAGSGSVYTCGLCGRSCESDADCYGELTCQDGKCWNLAVCLQAEPDVNPAPDLCDAHGGVQWQGQVCLCTGVIDSVTVCQDGYKVDLVTLIPCEPNPAACNPNQPVESTGSGGSGSSCPCTLKRSCEREDLSCVPLYQDCSGQVCIP